MSVRFDLQSGHQCIRDLFMCLQDNQLSWPDVSCHFNFTLTHSSLCCNCNYKHQFETDQLYLELQVPPNGSHLNTCVEEHLNTSDLVQWFCDSCRKNTQAEKRQQLTAAVETDFIVVLLTRGMLSNTSNVIPTSDVFIRY